MLEWPIRHAWRACDLSGSVGSNPTLSAIRAMKTNKAWHEKNRMPKDPTFEQRMEWHIAHAANCACRLPSDKLRLDIEHYLAKKHS